MVTADGVLVLDNADASIMNIIAADASYSAIMFFRGVYPKCRFY